MRKAKNSTEVLKAVEWILENVGWCQMACFRDKEGKRMGSVIHNDSLPTEDYHRLGSVCITGALGLVEADPYLITLANLRLGKAIPHTNPMEYNDDAGRTKRQMINLVRKAIKETK